jgi:FkbM family methyltransferase
VTFVFADGAIVGAGPVQYAGLRAMALAAKALHPLGDLGFSYAARLLRTLFPADRSVVVRYDGQSSFAFPYGDGYWSLLLNRSHVYEQEVEAFLLAIRDVDYDFIDCGANYGYWSMRVSSLEYGAHSVVAVEADLENYGLLERNWQMNGRRFSILHRAVSGRDGETVTIYGRKHEARSIVDDGSTPPRSSVETVTLDRLLELGSFATGQPIVLKLDIEGVEIAALKGGRSLLDRDTVIVYEDHGNDRDHEVTSYLMQEAAMRAYAYDKHRFFRLQSPRDLDALKVNRRRGYDFFATRCEFWQEKLERLAGRPPA